MAPLKLWTDDRELRTPASMPAPPAWAARSKSRDVHVQKHHQTEETSPAYLHGSNAENRLVTLLWSQEGIALTDSFWQTLDSVPAASSCSSNAAGPSSLSVPSLGPELALVFHRWTWLVCLDLFAVTPNEMTTRPLLSFSHFFVLFLIFLQSVLPNHNSLSLVWNSFGNVIMFHIPKEFHKAKYQCTRCRWGTLRSFNILHPLFFLSSNTLQTCWKPLIWNL